MEYALYFVILGAGLLMAADAIRRAFDVWELHIRNKHQRLMSQMQINNNRLMCENQQAEMNAATEQQRIALRREELNTLKSED